MSIFLVDYENVHVEGFNGLSNCTEKDSIKIFYTKGADTLTFGLHRRLSETKARIEYLKVENGSKNALDFQLSSYLGFLIASNAEEKYYIVSKDKGYEILIQFWSKYKSISAQVTLVSDLTLKVEKEIQAQLDQKVETTLKESTFKEHTIDIISIIDKYKTKSGINTALVKKYESKKAGEIYKIIKPLLTDKKGQ